VCINQKDIPERNAQVQLMHQVYKQCRRVIIWLGEGTAESDMGMNVIPVLVAALRIKEKAGDKRALSSVPEAHRARYGFPKRGCKELMGLSALFSRPWFTRVWGQSSVLMFIVWHNLIFRLVVQEVSLASEAILVCGAKAVRFEDFAPVVSNCGATLLQFGPGEDTGESFFKILINPTRKEAQKEICPPLLNLVARSRKSQATDSRDKIFALVGLAAERGIPGILGTPDYSLSPNEVFKRWMLDTISNSQNLDVLGLVDTKANDQPLHHPSWVPNLSDQVAPLTMTRLELTLLKDLTQGTKSKHIDFLASGDTLASTTMSGNLESFSVFGFIFDTVSHSLGDVKENSSSGQVKVNTFISWENAVGARKRARYITGENMMDVYWETMWCASKSDRHDQRLKTRLKPDYLQPFAAYRILTFGRKIQSNLVFVSVYLFALLFTVARNAIRQMGSKVLIYYHPRGSLTSEFRRMGKSTKGYVCLLPGSTQPGDSIALFRGAKVPFVIRKHSDGKNWQLLGETYVHGIMYGEAWDDSRCKEICLV
jgi:hypothetical protein